MNNSSFTIETANGRKDAMQKAHLWMEKPRLPVRGIYGSAELYEPKLEENHEQS